LENTANAAKDAEAARDKLQSALDEANAEIERLKSELKQTGAVPPQSSIGTEPSESESAVVGQ
jgi:hypothetical protein